MEKIICSAILMPDGYIIRGHRHHNCIKTAQDIPRYKIFPDRNEDKGRCIQGFITSENRFVDRKEAKKIATNAGQLIATTNSDLLFSEDIY